MLELYRIIKINFPWKIGFGSHDRQSNYCIDNQITDSQITDNHITDRVKLPTIKLPTKKINKEDIFIHLFYLILK
jgi:hypothetical protein